VQILQGFQIDTDHWRHFWMMLGLIWGLFGLTRAHRCAAALKPSSIRRTVAAAAGVVELRQG